jgi:hypothetical protein
LRLEGLGRLLPGEVPPSENVFDLVDGARLLLSEPFPQTRQLAILMVVRRGGHDTPQPLGFLTASQPLGIEPQ